MTLCIAATCQDYLDRSPSLGAGEPPALLACDWRVETDAAGAEIEIKDEMLHKRWFSLLAGPVAQARELNELYRDLFRTEELTPENRLEKLHNPLWRLRRRMADSYTQCAFSMPYAEFLEKGKAQLPDESFRQAVFEMGAQRIDAELILVGYMDEHFVLFRCAGCEVTEDSNFIAIGSGAQIATPVLESAINALSGHCQAARAACPGKAHAASEPGVGNCNVNEIRR